MLSREDNELLTRVEGDAPMGRMLRDWHWIPAVRAGRLEADGAPVRVKLFGENFVAFRATDGRVGFFDEACPHRGASLALARNEDCALRCVFHGWKFDVSGKAVEIPTEPRGAELFAERVKLKHYPVREAGGLIWTYIGKQEKPPRFPDFGFNDFPPEHLHAAVTTLPFNWVQALEATIDSAHIAFLHRDWMDYLGKPYEATAENLAPEYDVQDELYGFRGAALRPLANGTTHVRITEYVMPFHTSTPSINDRGSYQMLVPVDDHTVNWFFVRWSKTLPVDTGRLAPEGTSLDDWVPLPGGADEIWGQDRASMKTGSFAGFSGGLLTEDTVCQASMGSIVDRSKEMLSTTDRAVVRARRLLLQAVREHMDGKRPIGTDPAIRYNEIHGVTGVISSDERWQDHFVLSKSDWDLRKSA